LEPYLVRYRDDTSSTKRKVDYIMEGSLAERLRVLRARRGLTLVEAARKIGIGRDTLSNIERGRNHPLMPTLAKIANGYGVEVEELLEVGGAPASPKDSGLPEWVRAPDLEVFGRKISELPTHELRVLAVELVGGQRTRLLEDERDRPLSPQEVAERATNFARVMIVREEHERRGEELPEKFVLSFNRTLAALTPLAETRMPSHEAEPGREAG
jgi:transcriptional regulator with XRE-family HTH domain